MPLKKILDQNPMLKQKLHRMGLIDIAGFELYYNAILVYDSDIDSRLREVVDCVGYYQHNLSLVYEKDGTLTMLWKDKIPPMYHEGMTIATHYPDDSVDHWYIGISKLEKDFNREYLQQKWKGQFNLN